jgi:uncharacterized protein
METFLLSSLIVLFASTLQAATGFGFSLFAVPLLMLVHPPLAAIQINLVLSIALSAVMMPRLLPDIDRPLLGRLVRGGIAAVPVGVLALLYLDGALLRVMVGVVTLALTLLLVLKFRIRRSTARDYATGGLSGVFTAALGLAGVPLLLYFAGTDAPKAQVRSTVLSFFLFAYGLALAIQMAVGSVAAQTWIESLALLPVMAGGIFAGQQLFHRIDQKTFQVFLYAVLVASGSYLLWSS